MSNSLNTKTFKLPDTLEMGVVSLNVKNLDLMTKFYNEVLMFDLIKTESEKSSLGYKGKVLLILHKINGKKAVEGSAGLYHTAFLFEKRSHLALVLKNLFQNSPFSYTGSGDHTVSEAFYLNDPEANGVELYYDRDRTLWQWENGNINMGTTYIDEGEYVDKYIGEEKANIKVGHVHLKVGNIEEAKRFYAGLLGFDITFGFIPTALFVSAGGYHHHIGMNTWESMGAGIREDDTYGLGRFEILLNDQKTFKELVKRIKDSKYKTLEIMKDSLTLLDPWNNKILIKA